MFCLLSFFVFFLASVLNLSRFLFGLVATAVSIKNIN